MQISLMSPVIPLEAGMRPSVLVVFVAVFSIITSSLASDAMGRVRTRRLARVVRTAE
jgi:hypothetical protein